MVLDSCFRRSDGFSDFLRDHQPFLPDLVGQEPIKLVLGKNSGTSTIEYYLDKLGLKATDDQIKEITDRVKREGRIQRTLLTESQFAEICKEVIR